MFYMTFKKHDSLVENVKNVLYDFQEIFMNSFVFTTTDENKVDLWYNLSAA